MCIAGAPLLYALGWGLANKPNLRVLFLHPIGKRYSYNLAHRQSARTARNLPKHNNYSTRHGRQSGTGEHVSLGEKAGSYSGFPAYSSHPRNVFHFLPRWYDLLLVNRPHDRALTSKVAKPSRTLYAAVVEKLEYV